MSPRRWFPSRALPGVLALALFGCFDSSVGPSDDEAGTTQTAEDESSGCPDGSAGCACYGNGTCDAGLVCELGTCRIPDCVAGSLNCGCHEGQCFGGLVCQAGICKPDEAPPGCQSVMDCDGDLCTQGDAICESQCVVGAGVSCPLGAACDPTTGACLCERGQKVCGSECIPESQCCTDDDCPGGACEEHACTCGGGLVCGGVCLAGVVCCPGEQTTSGCSCGAKKTCSLSGTWSSCTGGNTNPQCTPGQTMPCGNCGTNTCTASCTWGGCVGGGPCSPGAMQCVGGKLETCQPSCHWMHVGSC